MENDGGSVWSQKTNNYEPVLRQSRKKGRMWCVCV